VEVHGGDYTRRSGAGRSRFSKRVFQVHAVDRSGRVVLAKAFSPERFFAWFAELPAGCLVAMEACGGAHHAARRLRLQGLDARLNGGHFITPYRTVGKCGKNDTNDGAAMCEVISQNTSGVPSIGKRELVVAYAAARDLDDDCKDASPVGLARAGHAVTCTTGNDDGRPLETASL